MLKERSSIFVTSVVNSAFFLLFTFLWYSSFSSVYLLGSEQPKDSGGFEILLFRPFSSFISFGEFCVAGTWVLDTSSYVVSTFLVFMYLWTASVVNYAQTFIISQITCHWYYHRLVVLSVILEP